VKRALPALVLVLVLVTSACSPAVSGTAAPIPDPANLALVDGHGTSAALDAVKTVTEAVFSYDSANPAAFDQTVAANVTGAAKDQLAAWFDPIRKSSQAVHQVTQVRKAAAVEFTGDRVRELAVLAQGSGASEGLRTVSLTAVRESGRWRLSDITVDPALPAPAPQPDDGSPGGRRDAALAGARTIAGALFTADSADPEGWYARAEAVTTDQLLNGYRANKATYIDSVRRSGTKVTLGANPVAGVLAINDAGAVVLFFTTLQVTDSAGKVTGRPFTAELDVVREGSAWKATGVRPVIGS
jgi:Mce-associated membrane protein